MELTTIAKPYANAVFAIATEDKNSQADWRAVLAAGAQLANDASLQAFIASPSVSNTDKTKATIELFQSVLGKKLEKNEVNFINLLLENGRITVLPNILALFDEKVNLGEDAKAFQVISAYPLNAEEEKKIISDLSKKHNATISVETKIDENLVGGLVIKEGDKVIDLSVQARLNELGSRLSVN